MFKDIEHKNEILRFLGKRYLFFCDIKGKIYSFLHGYISNLEYNPKEYPLLLQPILEGKADVVFGSRLVTTQPHRVLFFWHYLGNQFLTFLSNLFTNLNLTDMETCYKVFTREVVDAIKHKLISQRFGIEPELTARVKRYRIYEVGISYSGRTYKEGKKIGWKDGVSAIWCIIRFNLRD